jgi:hypothetical protein
MHSGLHGHAHVVSCRHRVASCTEVVVNASATKKHASTVLPPHQKTRHAQLTQAAPASACYDHSCQHTHGVHASTHSSPAHLPNPYAVKYNFTNNNLRYCVNRSDLSKTPVQDTGYGTNCDARVSTWPAVVAMASTGGHILSETSCITHQLSRAPSPKHEAYTHNGRLSCWMALPFRCVSTKDS